MNNWLLAWVCDLGMAVVELMFATMSGTREALVAGNVSRNMYDLAVESDL